MTSLRFSNCCLGFSGSHCCCCPHSAITQLQIIIKNQEAELRQREKADQGTEAPTAETIQQLSAVIERKDQELEVRIS